MRSFLVVFMLHVLAGVAVGQSSSMLLSPVRSRTANPQEQQQPGQATPSINGSSSMFPVIDPRDETIPMTRAIERVSLYAIPVQVPRKFKVEDLITIIVRQQKQYQGDALQNSEKRWDLIGKLSDWFAFYPNKPGNKFGDQQWPNGGPPGFQFDYDNRNQMNGQSQRDDTFSTRITAHIIDVKPNGNLVVEATLEEQHDEEVASITLTGICRSVDVTPDNTLLSTQIADLRLVERNHGPLRDETTRGWVPRILTFVGGPF